MLRELRASANNYDLPVIMFTAITGARDEEMALFNGAQDYIRKPFDPKFLDLKVRQALAARAEGPKHRDLREHLAQASGATADLAPAFFKRRIV